MTTRLSLKAIAERLDTDPLINPAPGTVRCGTSFDHDYITAFTTAMPAIWVVGQRVVRIDDGRGWSGHNRQNLRVEVALRLVVRRYADGVIDAEAALADLETKTIDRLHGWTPTGAAEHLTVVSSQDGPAYETQLTLDLILGCRATHVGGS